MRSAVSAIARRSMPGAGDFLDDFLVPALHRAVALEQVAHRAMAIAEHLEFDMPRPLDQPLEVDLGIAEAALRERARALDGAEQFRFVRCAGSMPMPPPPAAGLTSTGKPIARAAAMHRFGLGRQNAAARAIGMPCCGRQRPRPGLVTHRFQPRGLGPMKRAPASITCSRTRRSRPESRSPDGAVGAALRADHVQQRILVEVALARGRCRSYRMAFVGHRKVRQVAVRFRIDGHAGDAQLLQRRRTPAATAPRLATTTF